MDEWFERFTEAKVIAILLFFFAFILVILHAPETFCFGFGVAGMTILVGKAIAHAIEEF